MENYTSTTTIDSLDEINIKYTSNLFYYRSNTLFKYYYGDVTIPKTIDSWESYLEMKAGFGLEPDMCPSEAGLSYHYNNFKQKYITTFPAKLHTNIWFEIYKDDGKFIVSIINSEYGIDNLLRIITKELKQNTVTNKVKKFYKNPCS